MKPTVTTPTLLLLIVCITGATALFAYVPERQIAVTLTALPRPEGYTFGDRLPVTLLIKNGLNGEIGFSTFATEPNSWNGETYGCSMVDIYRDGKTWNLYLSRPQLRVPATVQGVGVKYIKPGKSLAIELDMSKWRLRDGWLRGRYEVVFRVDGITADEYVKLSVLSGPVMFEIR